MNTEQRSRFGLPMCSASTNGQKSGHGEVQQRCPALWISRCAQRPPLDDIKNARQSIHLFANGLLATLAPTCLFTLIGSCMWLLAVPPTRDPLMR